MTAIRSPLLLLFALVVQFEGIEQQALSAERHGSSQNKGSVALTIQSVTASSSAAGTAPEGAIDGNRFSLRTLSVWKGGASQGPWHWQADFGSQVEIGAILQVLGDDESVLSAAPVSYVWQISNDGETWIDLARTRTSAEHRMYRIHRLQQPVRGRYLRFAVAETSGEPPAIREIEVYASNRAGILFPAWILCVNSFEKPSLEECHRFLALARQCDGWSHVPSQFVWHGCVDPAMALAEPRPLCAFYTGSFRDWCEVSRSTWAGTEQLLENGSLPMWGACGGGQAFGILAETGVDHPWDCPKCRDVNNPKLPIYGHIGLVDPSKTTACGDYSNNIFEAGLTPVRLVQSDPVFEGLPDEFEVPENHCGQLEFVPDGWELVVTKGEAGKTWMQCMKRHNTCIYAAQFHIELPGTPEESRRIMSNFLAEAQRWSAKDHAAAPAEVREVTAIKKRR